jgi:hypothetical protein
MFTSHNGRPHSENSAHQQTSRTLILKEDVMYLEEDEKKDGKTALIPVTLVPNDPKYEVPLSTRPWRQSVW